MKLHIVSATRLAEADFWSQSALGQSIKRLYTGDVQTSAWIAYENQQGLPAIYNQVLQHITDDTAVAFIHDDVWLDDYFLPQRVEDALHHFDIIGLAGNRRRTPFQMSWVTEGANPHFDHAYISGHMAHGPQPFGKIGTWGKTPAACELMDGVFLAAHASVLRKHQVFFDERFDFHFYDLDFCRSARAKGLKLGTWPIAITHQSPGNFSSAGWEQARQHYFEKWGD